MRLSPSLNGSPFTRAAIAAALCLTGCQQSADAAGGSDPAGASASLSADPTDGEGASVDGSWSASQRHDPMTDGEVLQLTTWVAGTVNDIEVNVACDAVANTLHYDLNSFDKKREGAGIVTKFGDEGPYHPYTYRVDSGSIEQGVSPSRYHNQISLLQPSEAVTGQRLVVTIPFTDSDETYVIDQSDATFRKTIERCRQQRGEMEQRERDEQAAAAQQEQEQDAAPVAVEPGTSPAAAPTAPTPQQDDDQPPTWNSLSNP